MRFQLRCLVPVVVARSVGGLRRMSAIDRGCGRYGEDEMRSMASPRVWRTILVRSIGHTRRLGLPGRVQRRGGQREVLQEFLDECLATTVQAGIFALVMLAERSITIFYSHGE